MIHISGFSHNIIRAHHIRKGQTQQADGNRRVFSLRNSMCNYREGLADSAGDNTQAKCLRKGNHPTNATLYTF